MSTRTYLAVPYEDRDEAKALGARWDKENRAWYAPEGAEIPAGLKQWLPVVGVGRDTEIRKAFAEAMRTLDLEVDDMPPMDGKVHRVAVKGDRGKETSGAFKGYLDGKVPAGYFKNYRTGEHENWRSDVALDQADAATRAALSAQAAQVRAERHAERAAGHDAASKLAAAIFSQSERASPSNHYCRNKGMSNPGAEGLRMVPASYDGELSSRVQVAANLADAKERRKNSPDAVILLKGDLLVPAYDTDGKLWSIQSINPNYKSFLRGARKHGLHTIAGAAGSVMETTLKSNGSLPIVICEGRSTGDSLARALGQPIVVAFDAGNLRVVAETMRQQFPDRPIVIAGDNDHAKAHEFGPNGKPRGNRGLIDGEQAAEAVGGVMVAPKFQPGEKGSDWNDLATNKGLRAMRTELVAAIEQALVAKGIDVPAHIATARSAARSGRGGSSREPDPDPSRLVALRSPPARSETSRREVAHDR